MQETVLTQINGLLHQLNLVKQIAESEYWITTEELCLLLELDNQALEILKTKEPLFQFSWRNFVCTFVSYQGQAKLWQIKAQTTQQLSHISTAVPEKAYALSNQSNSKDGQATTPRLELQKKSAYISKQQGTDEVLPSQFIQVQNFLTPEELEQLLKFVWQQEPQFQPTTNSANDPNYRRSMVLHHFSPFSELAIERVRSVVPQILSHLGMAPFQIHSVEAQLTAHNDGNYYKIHNDSGSPDTASRELTYVYYFYREPKGFSGGELTIYDSKVENNFYVAADSFKTVQPLNNSIVFFLSRYMHEVLPVSCPSKLFADSRFTINGWVRRV